MRAFSLDSSCMIAAVCSWHEHHPAAAQSVERRFERGSTLAIAAHALLEAYAVLTRLPPPHRLAAADAWRLLSESFAEQGTVIVADGDTYVSMLTRLAAAGVVGGRSYDALIAVTLSRTPGLELLTLNPKHFDGLQPGLAIIDPTDES